MGFNPASEPKAAEADPGQCRELSGAEPSARFGSGSFTANAVEDGAEVSIGDVQTRVSNWCFGVSMLGR